MERESVFDLAGTRTLSLRSHRVNFLSDAICLKTLVLLGSALELFTKFFGTVRAIFWLWGSFLALELMAFLPEVPLFTPPLTANPMGNENQPEVVLSCSDMGVRTSG